MRKKSFTLMELVVSMAILALVGAVIASSLGIFINTYARSQKAEKDLQRNLAIDRAANTLFAGAIPFRWTNDDSEVQENDGDVVFSGEFNELWLSSIGQANPEHGAFVFARIYLENGDLCIDSSPYPLLPWDEIESQNFTREVLAGNVAEVEFRYAAIDPDDPDNIIWYENWEESSELSDSGNIEEIPAAISMHCIFEDGSELSWLRRTAGTSATGRYSTGSAATQNQAVSANRNQGSRGQGGRGGRW